VEPELPYTGLKEDSLSRTDTLLIGTDDSFDEIVGVLSRVLGVEAVPQHPGSTSDYAFLLGETGLVSFEDIPVEPLSNDDPEYDGITYELGLFDAAGPAEMTATSTMIYERVVAGTPWKVVLLVKDRPVATREALETA
jgi:hypothetical protein